MRILCRKYDDGNRSMRRGRPNTRWLDNASPDLKVKGKCTTERYRPLSRHLASSRTSLATLSVIKGAIRHNANYVRFA